MNGSGVLIALLPPLPGEHWAREALAAELTRAGHVVDVVPELDPQQYSGTLDPGDAWISHCALRLLNVSPHAARLLVASGDAAALIAAVGFAQRAGHRAVAGYVLVEGAMPGPGIQDWPDAPVTYVGEREAPLAGLRGWDVVSGEDVAAAVDAVARLSG